jgi:hypothetical protein
VFRVSAVQPLMATISTSSDGLLIFIGGPLTVASLSRQPDSGRQGLKNTDSKGTCASPAAAMGKVARIHVFTFIIRG